LAELPADESNLTHGRGQLIGDITAPKGIKSLQLKPQAAY
jgi:hypothetical protein